MDIFFPTRDLYNYLFSHCDDLPDAAQLPKSAFSRFCGTLEDELSRHAGENPRFRHVLIGNDARSFEEFFDAHRDSFLDFGNEVVFTGRPCCQMARKVEEKYSDPLVTSALREARRQARAS